MSDRQKIGKILRDAAKAFVIGAAAAASLGSLLFLGGFLFGGLSVCNGLEIMKDGLFLLVSLLLFILAGMLLLKGKNPERIRTETSWRKHFHVIGIKAAALFLNAGILLVAALADWMLAGT